MEAVIKTIRDWSEVWALLIPLAVILIHRPDKKEMRPVKIYIWVGLVVSLFYTILYVYHTKMPPLLKNNNVYYNLHSFVRVILLSWFISQFTFKKTRTFQRILLIGYLVFTAVNFIFFETPLYFSSIHFVAESVVLLVMTIQFFFRAMNDDSNTNWLQHPAFLVCAGICLYEAVNFFTFLFFEVLSDPKLYKTLWTIHNLTLIVLGIMLALGLYRSKKYKVSP